MKKICTILAVPILALAFASCGASASDQAAAQADSTRRADSLKKAAGYDTPDAIANGIVEAISKNDYAAFSGLFITKDEMIALLKGSTNPDDQGAIGRADDIMKDIISGAKASFDRVREGGNSDGIIWDQAKFKSSEYEMSKKDGIESMGLKIIVDYKGAEYKIRVDKIAKTSAGWKMVGQANYGDEMDAWMIQMIQDSIVAADSMAMQNY